MQVICLIGIKTVYWLIVLNIKRRKKVNNNSIGNSTNDQQRTDIKVDSDLFYGSLFKYNPDTVFFMNTDGIITKENGRFSETLGYSQKEIELSSLECFLLTSEISSYKEWFKKALSGENTICLLYIYT